MISDWRNVFKNVYFIWIFCVILNILGELSRCIKAYVLSNVKYFRINLIEKYGTWAVITGSSDGIGKAYATELAKRGINVVLISRSLGKLEKVASEIENKYNVKTRIIVADFSKGKKIYEPIEKQLRDIPVGILVNNVGCSMGPVLFSDCMSQEIVNAVNVNVVSTLLITRMILPQMQERKKGAIINVTLTGEDRNIAFSSLYGASKTCVKNFTETLRVECLEHGITVQRLLPGGVRTKMVLDRSKIIRDHPWLLISPETYAKAAVNSLGLVDHTAGHWLHEIYRFILNSIPNFIITHGSKILLTNMRK